MYLGLQHLAGLPKGPRFPPTGAGAGEVILQQPPGRRRRASPRWPRRLLALCRNGPHRSARLIQYRGRRRLGRTTVQGRFRRVGHMKLDRLCDVMAAELGGRLQGAVDTGGNARAKTQAPSTTTRSLTGIAPNQCSTRNAAQWVVARSANRAGRWILCSSPVGGGGGRRKSVPLALIGASSALPWRVPTTCATQARPCRSGRWFCYFQFDRADWVHAESGLTRTDFSPVGMRQLPLTLRKSRLLSGVWIIGPPTAAVYWKAAGRVPRPSSGVQW